MGNLFYAIAAADKKIRPEERNILHEEILYAWKHHDHSMDRFGSDRAFLIEFEFETMEDKFETAENAFLSFVRFFKENENEIDIANRIKIFNSARHIAESVRKINADELGYLLRLKEMMKL